MSKIIRLEEVSKEFGNLANRITAVNRVSMEFHEGESVSIMGPSGCGKSTLLNLIGLIQKPTEGHLFIDSNNTVDYSEKEKANIRNGFFGYIAQKYLLMEKYTVAENVEIPLLYRKEKWNHKIRKEKVMEVLEKVGLADRMSEDVKNLSGGQQQRVAIARALVNEPKIILADEPTGALDTKMGNEIICLLLGLVAEGKTLIVVTHNYEIAKQCNLKIMMENGSIMNS